MTAPSLPAGANALTVLPRAVRGMLWQGLRELANDPQALDSLLALPPPSLREPDAEAWAAEARAVLLSVTAGTPGQRRLTIAAGYPVSDAAMPWVSVITETGSEAPAETFLGDWHVSRPELVGQALAVLADGSTEPLSSPPTIGTVDARFAPVITHEVRGSGATEQIQVAVWHPVVEVAELLHAALRRVALLRKGDLDAVGARSVGLAWSGFQPNQQVYPRLGWVPMLRLTVGYALAHAERVGPQPAGVRVLPGRFNP